MTNVAGMNRTRNENAIDESGLKTDGYVTLNCSMNASAAAFWSRRVLTPTNCTGLDAYSFASASSSGCSRRHGPHHEPQKFTTPTLPEKIADEIGWSPRSVEPLNAGAALRSAAGILTTWKPVVTPIPPADPEQPASSPASARAAASGLSTARRVIPRRL